MRFLHPRICTDQRATHVDLCNMLYVSAVGCRSLRTTLFSPIQCELHVELLTVIAHYHCTGQTLALGQTVNFGRPWLHGSTCEYGLISLPYLDGPEIEDVCPQGGRLTAKCCWLIPITESERNYKRIHGLEALEFKFDESKFDYLDPYRRSVV